MAKKKPKALLIVFFRGKRRVFELSDLTIEKINDLAIVPSHLIIRENTKIHFYGYGDSYTSYMLTGKHKKKGKRLWNRFLNKLKST